MNAKDSIYINLEDIEAEERRIARQISDLATLPSAAKIALAREFLRIAVNRNEITGTRIQAFSMLGHQALRLNIKGSGEIVQPMIRVLLEEFMPQILAAGLSQAHLRLAFLYQFPALYLSSARLSGRSIFRDIRINLLICPILFGLFFPTPRVISPIKHNDYMKTSLVSQRYLISRIQSDTVF
jgi:hypothetical protein